MFQLDSLLKDSTAINARESDSASLPDLSPDRSSCQQEAPSGYGQAF
jgi:hypothetical protein